MEAKAAAEAARCYLQTGRLARVGDLPDGAAWGWSGPDSERTRLAVRRACFWACLEVSFTSYVGDQGLKAGRAPGARWPTEPGGTASAGPDTCWMRARALFEVHLSCKRELQRAGADIARYRHRQISDTNRGSR